MKTAFKVLLALAVTASLIIYGLSNHVGLF